MRQERGTEMNPDVCNFTKKCSQLLSHMGYLWTNHEVTTSQSYLLGVDRVGEESVIIWWFCCFSLVKSTPGDMNSSILLGCITQPRERPRPPQHQSSGQWWEAVVSTCQISYDHGSNWTLSSPKMCESKLELLRPRTKESSWGLERKSQRNPLGST